MEKIKILEAVLDLPDKQHQQSSNIYFKNGPNWQCYLPGSSKTATRILIFFLITIGANYSYEMKNSEI